MKQPFYTESNLKVNVDRIQISIIYKYKLSDYIVFNFIVHYKVLLWSIGSMDFPYRREQMLKGRVDLLDY